MSARTASIVLDELVRRQAALRGAEIHRPPRGHDAHTELPCRLDLRLDQALAPTREDVVVVENRRAAGERELCEPGARRGVFRLGVDLRPHRIQLAEPGEQVCLLGTRARQGLVEVVVGVDEPWSDDRATEVDPVGRLRLGAGADLGDRRALDEQPAAVVLRPLVVHRDDDGVCVEGS